MDSLQIGTPVWVKRRGQPLAQGEVAYLGKVDFSDYKDWVGVQLVGASAGQGRNNGSVAGVTYFACPSLCGLFVRQGAINIRTTTATASPMSSSKIKGRMSPRTPPSAHLKKSTKATAPLSPRTRPMNHKSTPVGLTIKIIADTVPTDETGNLPQLHETAGEEETQLFLQNVEEDKVVVDDFETPYQPFNILQNAESPEEEIEFDDQTGISTIESKSMHRLNLEAMFERNGVLLPPSKRKPEKKLVEERKIALENWRKQRRRNYGSGSCLPKVLENQPERKSRQRERPRSKSLAPSAALRRNATLSSSKKIDRSKPLTPKRETPIRSCEKAENNVPEQKAHDLVVLEGEESRPTTPSSRTESDGQEPAIVDREQRMKAQMKRARLRAAKLQVKMEQELLSFKTETVLEISHPSSEPPSPHALISATACLYDLVQFLGFLFMLDRFLTSLVKSGERKFAEAERTSGSAGTTKDQSPRRRAWNRLVQSLKQIKSLQKAGNVESDERTSATSSHSSHDKVGA